MKGKNRSFAWVKSAGSKDEGRPTPEFVVQSLLTSPTITIRDTYCQGSCRHQNTEECAATTQLVFPYRGVYVRHLGHDQAVAEANQVLFFNDAEGYRVSHPVLGGDASLSLAIGEAQLRELAPASFLRGGATLELVALDLRIAVNAIGEIVGKTATDDLLDSIFSQFCLGK